MQTGVALCQIRPATGRPSENAEKVMSLMGSGRADVYVFPELFMTGYGADYPAVEDETADCIGRISDACRETDTAVAVGTPRRHGGRLFNSLAFLSPDGDVFYDKTHLARFGIYAEDCFAGGNGPAMGRYHGMGFGLCICYDVFFPEILHGCSLSGASVNICAAASAVQSKPFMDTVLPARALEDVTYLAYVNNTGPLNGLEMHGCSRAFGPLGREAAACGEGECIRTFVADTAELESARSVRRHLEDFRGDVEWLPGPRSGCKPIRTGVRRRLSDTIF